MTLPNWREALKELEAELAAHPQQAAALPKAEADSASEAESQPEPVPAKAATQESTKAKPAAKQARSRPQAAKADLGGTTNVRALSLSAKTGEGMPVLVETLLRRAALVLPAEGEAALSERQRNGLERISESLLLARQERDAASLIRQIDRLGRVHVCAFRAEVAADRQVHFRELHPPVVERSLAS